MTVPVLSPGALAFCGQRLTAYRHFWRSSLISSVLEPALFLASMGLTLGILVDRGPGLPGGVSYLSFLAPGLFALFSGLFSDRAGIIGIALVLLAGAVVLWFVKPPPLHQPRLPD